MIVTFHIAYFRFQYILSLEGLLRDMNDLAKKDKKFDTLLKEFESQKVSGRTALITNLIIKWKIFLFSQIADLIYLIYSTHQVCYLPITTFLLKPAHRILNYKGLLGLKLWGGYTVTP